MPRKAIPISLFLLLALFFLGGECLAGPSLDEITTALDHAQGPADVGRQAALLEAMTSGPEARKSYPALTQLTRAYYLIGESEKKEDIKRKYLDRALAASERALAAGPLDCHALYWRCMALLQKADIVNGLSALGLVKEALRGLEEVAAKDALYDSAGAYRSRGKVLIEAPGWAFIGDRKKGLALLMKAKETAPGSLINRLYLAQAFVNNDKLAEARAEIDYIIKAPVGPDSKDDLEVKDDARKLLKEIGNK